MAIKIGLVSLGCAKNRVDAEVMMGKLQAAGYKLVEEAGMADVAIVNTCGFIDDAKKEAIEEILELVQLKKEGRIRAILVTGCLAERYRTEIRREIPEVDAVIGIGANGEIVELVQQVLDGAAPEIFPPKEALPLCGERVQTTPYYTSYLKIAEGCDNRCTYCAIPMIRGAFRSRPIEELVAEAAHLAKNGVRELNIIAQDTTQYGVDLYGAPRLAELLHRLGEIDGLRWIRVLYLYPDRLTDDVIDAIASEPKVVKYIDIPLQHCDAQVLRRMNRFGDRASLTALIQKLRDRIPGVTLRTTVMVGFPGETEAQFTELAEFVRDVRFDRLGCFAYSAEDGTPAARLPDQLTESVKQQRQENIMELQMTIMAEGAEQKVGSTVQVLVEGYDRYASSFFGRTPADAPEVDGKIFFTAKTHALNAGELVTVRVTDTLDGDLIGELTAREANS